MKILQKRKNKPTKLRLKCAIFIRDWGKKRLQYLLGLFSDKTFESLIIFKYSLCVDELPFLFLPQ